MVISAFAIPVLIFIKNCPTNGFGYKTISGCSEFELSPVVTSQFFNESEAFDEVSFEVILLTITLYTPETSLECTRKRRLGEG